LFSVVVGNIKTVGDDLAALEKQLYDWALAEGYFDRPPHPTSG
jgi:hypothetical protein